MTRALGWRKPDGARIARLQFAGVKAAQVFDQVLPADSADASALVKILNQGSLGSCTTNAIGQMIRAEMVRTGAPEGTEFPSRLWQYSLALADDRNFGRDVGTHLCTVIDIDASYGFPPESAWPYDISQFGNRPPVKAWHDAFDQRAAMPENGGEALVVYHQINDEGCDRIDTIRRAITAGRLVAFGTPVTEAFCSSSPGPNDIVVKPNGSEPIAGGHAMCWCGYQRDEVTGRWKFRTVNSWGEEWGDGGFFWMDQDYVAWDETSDIWTVSKVARYSGGNT